jgi:UPF0176 protein
MSKRNLHNRVNREELKVKLRTSDEKRVTLSFYQYAKIPNPAQFRDELYAKWLDYGIFGRVYVAHEGINAQVSLPEEHKDAFRDLLYSVPFLNGIRLNWAVDDDGKSFFKLTIKVRDKIVADGLNDAAFDVTDCGTHLKAVEFNEIIARPDAVVVDMRNHYESEVGHFKNAICPDVDTFRDSLPIIADMLADKKDQPIVMYCTGGIRCEKASAYMKYKGFKDVYQLEGGIIEYTRQAKEQGIPNEFIGKNFVFDERLGERISEDIIAKCHQCGEPCDTHVNCANYGCHLLFIQCEKCAEKFNHCCTTECKEIIALPADVQETLRAGIHKGRQVFKKGRALKELK